MRKFKLLFGLFLTFLGLISCLVEVENQEEPIIEDARIAHQSVNPLEEQLRFYRKGEKGNSYQNIGGLKSKLEKSGEKLIFAMNGGMYDKGRHPVGLYIENGRLQKEVNKLTKGKGNFYLQPNGVFYINKNKTASIVPTDLLVNQDSILYATQSGPMLVIEGKLHPAFNLGSKNLHIRNGVGLLPDGRLLFAISKEKINFFDFASFFKKNGCRNALYLDGFVSRAYIPNQGLEQMDGNFGLMIGVVE